MENKSTGTTTLGLICKDGIVLAADRRATAGYLKVEKMDKIYLITDKIALTTAGSVSDVQVLMKILKAELKLNEVRTGREITIKEAANLLATLIFHNIRSSYLIPAISHFLMAGVDQHGLHLYDLYPDGSLTKVKNFMSSGSGSVFAFGVLETLYKKDMTIDEGITLAVKGINAALQRDIASGDGINVVVITKQGAKKVLTKEITSKIEFDKKEIKKYR